MTNNDTTKRAALSLLSRGLATQAEIAELAEISRTAVSKWVAQAGFDYAKARKVALLKLWQKALRRVRN